MSGKLSNPNRAHAHGDPNPTGDQFNETADFFAATSVAIDFGTAVALVWDNTEKTMKVEAWDTDASGQSAQVGYGVAIDTITETKTGRVVLWGYAEVNVGAGTAAEGSVAIGTTTAGVAGVAAPDATTIVGTTLGTFLGAKDADNRAPVWVSPT